MKIGWISLGCPKNQVDTDYMIGLMNEAGFTLTSSPKEAEVLVINTCAFIQPATQESIETILEFAQYKKGQCRLLVVVGCLPQRYKEELAEAIPEVDLWLGTGDYSRLPELIAAALEEKSEGNFFAETLGGWLPPEYKERPLSTPPYLAYVKIAEGCDHRCLYCIIPQLKGGYRSRRPEAIEAEVKQLLARGVKEINLVAQDTTAYGIDSGGEFDLPLLLSNLDKLDGEFWIRIMYTYPSRINDRLLTVIKEAKHICHYLDLPLQHISERVLRGMGRKTTTGEIKELIEKIREYLPDIALRSTFILGYPGETDEEFNELLAFLREYRLDWVGAFPYYREEGTAAAKIKPQVHPGTRKKRARILIQEQQAISLQKNQELIGREIMVLLEKKDDAGWVGRSYREAPEIDGLIKLELEPEEASRLQPGLFVRAVVTGADTYETYAQIRDS
ncbi:MAG: 30S ribosomal protein S12 methylthiotransferase RimO [Firmicutes bacterium]|nr:30S ribosomal protein S12 methylthiotransferase RimO [Bacillota bacterium]